MKKKTIVFSKKAEEDIASIVAYIALDHPSASQAFRESIRHTCSLLVEMPEMAPFCNFGHSRLMDIRLWPLKHFEKYLLIYRVTEEFLEIIRVVHGARNLPALFEAENESDE
ncbi:type II toxin-antitoxin system RelE/ParE family toxin [Methylocaldum sp. RMAD-M]|jgi:toxin ParE1/3/4|uniref:type II toxin-antitoxin system RelE/ParE family toxin n=1 Tax=Methylocaldum sp. RMAD-M TaxID=2806557 RepID=UPI001AE60617|nr:type II toxin-antitoxin system RelE/ParE family toxin [Methylocaldum sp. RMAD-M]MBP1152541.1 toxin ParE1/3/4 [Methylocaldum sp. RMAD-M]